MRSIYLYINLNKHKRQSTHLPQLFNKWGDSEYDHYLGIDNNHTGYVFCGASSADAMVGGEKAFWWWGKGAIV